MTMLSSTRKKPKSQLTIDPIHYFGLIFGIAALYFITGHLSFWVFNDNHIVTSVIFAAEGFALAGVILFGSSIWPGIFLGQTVLALSTGLDWLPSAGIGLINSMEALIGAKLFYYFRLDRQLSTLRDVLGLLALSALVLQPFSAILGNGILWSAGLIQTERLHHSIFSWWLGNVLGQFLFTPTLLLLRYKKINAFHLMGSLLFFAVLGALIFLIYPIHRVSILFSITLPLMLLVSVYLGRSYALINIIMLTLMAIYAVDQSIVNFSGNFLDNLIDLNFYILSHILLVLIVGTLFKEKQAGELKLKQLALYDALTSLPNRHFIEERDKQFEDYIRQYTHGGATVLFIQLKGLQNLYELMGQDSVDKAIYTIGHRLQSILEDDILIRWNTYDFLMIADIQSKEQIKERIERIFYALSYPIQIQEQSLKLSAYIGISFYPQDSNCIMDVIHFAEWAMKQAKKENKFYHVYTGAKPVQASRQNGFNPVS